MYESLVYNDLYKCYFLFFLKTYVLSPILTERYCNNAMLLQIRKTYLILKYCNLSCILK